MAEKAISTVVLRETLMGGCLGDEVGVGMWDADQQKSHTSLVRREVNHAMGHGCFELICKLLIF